MTLAAKPGSPRPAPRSSRSRSCASPGPGSRPSTGFRLPADPSGRDVGVELMFEQMVRGHIVLFAALFVQPHPPAFVFRAAIIVEVKWQVQKHADWPLRAGLTHLPR